VKRKNKIKKPQAEKSEASKKIYADGYESFSENLYEYDGNEEIKQALIQYKKDLRK
jgi:hypothetical protein